MSEKPRRWFRLHLSAALVLTFVAGCGLYANLDYSHETTTGTGFKGSESWSQIGLPLPCMTKMDKVELKPDGTREGIGLVLGGLVGAALFFDNSRLTMLRILGFGAAIVVGGIGGVYLNPIFRW